MSQTTAGLVDLARFCYHGDDRYYLQKPWTRGEFTYATDGRIMVRVPARADIPDEPSAPNILDQDFPFPHPILSSDEWVGIPQPLPEPEQVRCSHCKGTGIVYRHADETTKVPCGECDGKGHYPSARGVWFRRDGRVSVKLSEIYLAILTTLSVIRLAPFAQAATEPCPWMAEPGMLGYLMPMREIS